MSSPTGASAGAWPSSRPPNHQSPSRWHGLFHPAPDLAGRVRARGLSGVFLRDWGFWAFGLFATVGNFWSANESRIARNSQVTTATSHTSKAPPGALFKRSRDHGEPSVFCVSTYPDP